MALLGAEVLLYPTAIGSDPPEPDDDSRTRGRRVQRGHAVANAMPLVAANRIGAESGRRRARHPLLRLVVHRLRDGRAARRGVADRDGGDPATVDLDAVRYQREDWTFFRDRRPELYGPLLTLDGEQRGRAEARRGRAVDQMLGCARESACARVTPRAVTRRDGRTDGAPRPRGRPGSSRRRPTRPKTSPRRRCGCSAAARRVLARDGFSGLTLEAITSEAGENKAAVKYHFGGKDALITALVEWLDHDDSVRLVSQLREERDPEARLDLLLELQREGCTSHEENQLFFDLLPHVLRDPELRERLADLYTWYRELDGWVLSPEEDARREDVGAWPRWPSPWATG